MLSMDSTMIMEHSWCYFFKNFKTIIGCCKTDSVVLQGWIFNSFLWDCTDKLWVARRPFDKIVISSLIKQLLQCFSKCNFAMPHYKSMSINSMRYWINISMLRHRMLFPQNNGHIRKVEQEIRLNCWKLIFKWRHTIDFHCKVILFTYNIHEFYRQPSLGNRIWYYLSVYAVIVLGFIKEHRNTLNWSLTAPLT